MGISERLEDVLHYFTTVGIELAVERTLKALPNIITDVERLEANYEASRICQAERVSRILNLCSEKGALEDQLAEAKLKIEELESENASLETQLDFEVQEKE